MRRVLVLFPVALLLFTLGLAAIWGLSTPSHDRVWRADYDRAAQVTTLPDGRVRLDNLRNWSYAPAGTPASRDWMSVEIDPAALIRVWFLMEPFGNHAAIAHTMLSFEFADGNAYVASVEARREVGEGYSAIRAALLPTYEYLWVWATERDTFGNSAWFTDDQLYLYAVDVTPEEARAILRVVLEDTAEIARQPRWYHTLSENCTNVLARTVNQTRPDAVPWDISWILPGYADSFLYDLGYIGNGRDFAAAERAAHVTPLIPQAYAETDPAAFSRRLRALMASR